MALEETGLTIELSPGEQGAVHVEASVDQPNSLACHWQLAELPRNLKRSFVTRNVPADSIAGIEVIPERRPRAGDLVCARIERIGQQSRIHLGDGRRSTLHPGDSVLVAYGNRYAPDQYEAEVPATMGPCELVTCGGVASSVLSRHSMRKPATGISPLGYAVDGAGQVLNLGAFGLASIAPRGGANKPVIAVVGTSMNAGKTTTATALIKAYEHSGLGVAAVKATGTGSGNDLWDYADSGAALTLDFTDAGYASTYKLTPEEIENCFCSLVTAATASPGIDCVVVEVADGLLHGETADLVCSRGFSELCGSLVFAAGEAMGAVAGAAWLEQRGLPVKALSGPISASALTTREVQRGCSVPVLTRRQLESPRVALSLLSRELDACHA